MRHEFARLQNDRVRPLGDVATKGFWDRVGSVWVLLVDTRGQVDSVRKVLAHAEFVWLFSPYVRGRSDDELPFACELLRLLFARQSGDPLREVQVHIEGPDRTRRQS